MKKKSQLDAIKSLLRTKRAINLMTAFKATGTMKLATRCSELIIAGWKIEKKKVRFKTRYGTYGSYTNYKLISEPK
jgi:Helix-turn-helix domain